MLSQLHVVSTHKHLADSSVQLPGKHHTLHLIVCKLLNYLIISSQTLGDSGRLKAKGKISPKQLHCINYFVRSADWQDNATDCVSCHLNVLFRQN